MADSREHTGESAAPRRPVPDHLAYRACRENIISLLRKRPETANVVVPACPDWTVQDLVAHLLGICTNTLKSLGEPQAPRPAGKPALSDLLDEWAWKGQRSEELLAASGQWFGPLVLDVFTHELDLRSAIDEPAPDDHPAYPGALNIALGGLSSSVQARGLPPLRFEISAADWSGGAGGSVATVRAQPYDMYRSATGRRSHRQISELSWNVPADPWLPAFAWGPFNPPAHAVEDAIGVMR
jgi:uncharacterized protein (TIGR03083 family)